MYAAHVCSFRVTKRRREREHRDRAAREFRRHLRGDVQRGCAFRYALQFEQGEVKEGMDELDCRDGRRFAPCGQAEARR